MAMGRAAWAIDVDARPAAAWFEDALRTFREIDEPAGIGSMLGPIEGRRSRGGGFVPEVRVIEFAGDGRVQFTNLIPASSGLVVGTAAEARAMNLNLAEWFFAVSAPSPSIPVGTATLTLGPPTKK
jgi:hypothetical protein